MTPLNGKCIAKINFKKPLCCKSDKQVERCHIHLCVVWSYISVRILHIVCISCKYFCPNAFDNSPNYQNFYCNLNIYESQNQGHTEYSKTKCNISYILLCIVNYGIFQYCKALKNKRIEIQKNAN